MKFGSIQSTAVPVGSCFGILILLIAAAFAPSFVLAGDTGLGGPGPADRHIGSTADESGQPPWNPDRELQFAADLITAAAGKPYSSRIDQETMALIGKPFSWHSLGEGPEGDFAQRPLYRFDKFDCSTWVETAMALANAKSPADFPKQLAAIRYKDGVVSFKTRNHFPDADWIKNNIAAGHIIDATAEVLGELPPHKASFTFLRSDWYHRLNHEDIYLPKATKAERSRRLSRLRHLEDTSKPETAEVTYIGINQILVPKNKLNDPYFAAINKRGGLVPVKLILRTPGGDDADPNDYLVNQELLDRIPSPAIFQIIKPKWDKRKDIGVRLNISHIGIFIRKGTHLLTRQMSLAYQSSVEIPLVDDLFFLRLKSKYVRGINFYRLIAAGETTGG